MPLSRWLLLLTIMMGLGCLQVAQRNAIFFKGYAVAERMNHLHHEETDVARLQATVTGLISPMRLSRVAQDRHLKLVAWSTLSPTQPLVAAVPAELHQQSVVSDHIKSFVNIAAVDRTQPTTTDETAE